jgi:hypothetical protein
VQKLELSKNAFGQECVKVEGRHCRMYIQPNNPESIMGEGVLVSVFYDAEISNHTKVVGEGFVIPGDKIEQFIEGVRWAANPPQSFLVCDRCGAKVYVMADRGMECGAILKDGTRCEGTIG